MTFSVASGRLVPNPEFSRGAPRTTFHPIPGPSGDRRRIVRWPDGTSVTYRVAPSGIEEFEDAHVPVAA